MDFVFGDKCCKKIKVVLFLLDSLEISFVMVFSLFVDVLILIIFIVFFFVI